MAFSDNSKVVKIDETNFESLKATEQLFIIDFWATWCGPCRKLSSIIEEIAAEYEGKILIGECNIEENNNIAVEYSILTLPTLIFLKNGVEIEKSRVKGLLAKKEIIAKIESYR